MAKVIKGANQDANVKRLLRSQSTQHYVTERGWTANPEEAKDFTDALEAAKVCARKGLTHMELALRMEARGCDLFCMPLP